MLDISVELISGTFHGSEWPPSPSRLYQAMLAGGRYRFRHGPGWRPEFEDALRWLEVQPPPVIVAPRPYRGTPYLIFGPDNDADLWVRERINEREGHPPKTPMDRTTLRSQIERRPTYATGTVHYLYPEEDATPLPELEVLAQSILALGHGIDIATGDAKRIAAEESGKLPGDRWEPDPGGDVLLFAPTKGWYDCLESNFQRWRSPASVRTRSVDARRGTVPPSVRAVAYRNPLEQASRPFLAYAFQRLSDGHPHSVSWEDGMEVAARLRHTTSEMLRSLGADEPFLRAYALGHGTGEERDRRLSYVPLPSIGHQHVDGRVRRALVVGPPGPWDSRARVLGDLLEGARLAPPGGSAEYGLVSITDGDVVLKRYLSPSQTWCSVTPMVLHGHDARNGRVNVARTRLLIEQALEQARLGGAVLSYAYRNAPWWPGTGSARSIRVPSHLSSWPRYHVRLELRHDVRGPLLAGIGRHYGIGLFAASWGDRYE